MASVGFKLDNTTNNEMPKFKLPIHQLNYTMLLLKALNLQLSDKIIQKKQAKTAGKNLKTSKSKGAKAAD